MPTAAQDHSHALEEENRRIREVYAQRKEPGLGPLDPYDLYRYHELLEALAILFRKIGLASLANQKMLDVGCGSGGMLWRLQVFGARPKNCTGIDLLSERLEAANRAIPEANFLQANAARLPFRNDAFDLIFQFLVFTSILDSEIRNAMAREIFRTLRPGGYFISYDFRYSNPRNPNVRGVKRSEMKRLFPDCELKIQGLTLAPPIGRTVGRISPMLCRVLGAVPVLRTHDLCLARKPETTEANPPQS